jgi:hypothetical protein
MKNPHLLWVLFCLMTFVGYGQQMADSVKVMKPTQPNVLKRNTYSIHIPQGWKLMDGCQENLCSLLSPADTLSGFDRFTENINFTLEKVPSATYTVDKYAAYSENYLPKVVKNFKVLDRKKIRPNAYRLTYKGEKSGFSQTWRQYYYIKNQKIYIVTFACETSKYAFYLPLIEPHLNSFKVF